MPLYCGIDLHASNSYISVIDASDEEVLSRRYRNDLEVVLGALEPYRSDLAGVAVESTFNWYWLVDGLMEAGYRTHLVHPPAAQPYKGLKYSDDQSDARWLARMLQLGILPTGWICPREERSVRDLLRTRARLVRLRTGCRQSLRNRLERSTMRRLSANELARLTEERLADMVDDEPVWLSMAALQATIDSLSVQIERVEDAVVERARLKRCFRILTSIPGVGRILAATIQYETGDLERFATVGQYVSYCRLVPAVRLSNQRRKGQGLRKNGNPYLSWAYHEAAHFAVRFQPPARRWYQRKRAQTGDLVAIRALAHKLARAAYRMLHDQVAYEPARLFG